MTPGSRRPIGLAAQILRVTLSIGALTILAAGGFAIVGTSRMVSEQIDTRDAAAIQAIEDALQARFADAERVSARAAQVTVAEQKPTRLQSTLAPVFKDSLGTIKTLDILNEDMTIVAAFPASQTAVPSAAIVAAAAALRGGPEVVRTADASGYGSVWLPQPVVNAAGVPLVVLVQVDIGFLQDLLAADARQWRSVYILERGSVLAGTARESIDFSTIRSVDASASSGRMDVWTTGGTRYTGHFNDVEGVPGLGWRLVILEPASVVPRDTVRALWPTVAVLVIGGLIALAGAWFMARRLVAPLKQLESAALRAARGAYVKPIESAREDELGRVATAFNAVALRLNALHDLSQLLASSSQLDQVLDGILSAMGHIVGPGVAAIYLLQDGERWLVPVRARGVDITLAPAVDAVGDTWLARALKESGPSEFTRADRDLAEELPGLVVDETAALVAPLVSGNETLGVVVVLASEGGHATEAELEMVRTFSAQAAVAVQNSRLFAIESESRRVAEGLQSVAERLVRPGGLGEALAEVEHTIMELFGAVHVGLAVVDRMSLGLSAAADRDEESEILGMALRVLDGPGAHRPRVVRPGDDRGGDAIMERVGARELIVVPVAYDSAHGAVLVVAYGMPRATRSDLELADAVANEIALSLDNAYFFEQALERATSLETVFRISQAVGSSLDVKVVLNRVLDVVQKILSADAVALMTYDARKRVIATEMARGAVSPSMVERVYRSGDDVVGFVFGSGEPASFRDMHEDMEGIAGDAAKHGLRSMLAVPLLARGRSIGVLTAYSALEGAFTDDDMSMLQTFASQAALAIDTARLYSREHEVATVLQRSILPGALPEFDGLDAASAYEPAGGDAEIGGDYYDLFRASDSTIWLAIGDVCGKGVVAATKTSMIKFSVRSLVAAGFPPGRVLTEVNRMVAESGDPSDIVTLWVGCIDRTQSRLTWASGGHPPALLRHGGGTQVTRLHAGGPLLGAIAEVTYTDETIEFGSGDAILLYTDGVTEARSGNTFFGEARVEEAFVLGDTAAEAVEELRSAVRRFVQSELRDDVAILAVRLTAQADAAGQKR